MFKKSLLFSLAAFACAIALLVSCNKEEKVQYLVASVKIDESALGDAPSPDSYDVTFTNVSTGYVREVTSKGTSVNTDSLITGVYNVVAQAQFSEGGFAYNYIGTLSNVEVSESMSLSIPVTATKASATCF